MFEQAQNRPYQGAFYRPEQEMVILIDRKESNGRRMIPVNDAPGKAGIQTSLSKIREGVSSYS